MYLYHTLSELRFENLTKTPFIMKSLPVYSLIILALTIGCDNTPAQNNGNANHKISQAVPVENQNQDSDNSLNQAHQNGLTQASQPQNDVRDELIMHTIMNNETGEPLVSLPVPKSWELIKDALPGQPGTKGPYGLTITNYPPQSFIYTDNPEMYRMLQSNGENIVAPVGIDNVLTQQLIPQGQQMGMTLVNQYPLPETVAKEIAYYSQLSGYNPQNINQAMGTEWTDGEGNKVLAVLTYYESKGPYSISWTYNVTMLKVQQAHFEKAKNQLIYALSNKAFNQKQINDFNKQMAAKLKADNDNYQANQEIIRKGTQDRARINSETNEYIRNLNKASDEYRQHSNDVVQEQMSNHLNDVNVVVSPYDGKEYQVETGSKIYWINDEGKYYQTDDLFFDPNNYESQPGVWKKAPMKEYK